MPRPAGAVSSFTFHSFSIDFQQPAGANTSWTLQIPEYNMSMNQKIIFLDIDGVLTNIDLDQSSFEVAEPEKYHLSKENLQWLDMVLRETGAKIVIASNWRRFRWPNIFCFMRGAFYKSTLEHLRELYPNDIIGELPTARGITKSEALWLWFAEAEYESRDAGRYVILEDDISEGYQDYDVFKKHLILTDKQIGLTKADALRAIEMLNRQNS